MAFELYHISLEDYEPGQELNALDYEETHYYKLKVQTGEAWVDEFLDRNRPSGYPSRMKTHFAFSRPGMCVHFFEKTKRSQAKLYKVEMADPVSCPMAMIAVIMEHGQVPDIALATEYWTPVHHWHTLEYLSPYMTIIEQVEMPDKLAVMQAAGGYTTEILRGRELFPVAQ